MLVMCAAMHERAEKWLSKPFVSMCAVFFCTLGTVLTSFPFAGPDVAPTSVLLGGVLTGLGSATILLMLAIFFASRKDLAPLVFVALVGSTIAASLCYLLPQSVLFILVLCLPMVIVGLLSVGAHASDDFAALSIIGADDLNRYWALVGKLVVMVLLFYSINGIAKTFGRGDSFGIDFAAVLLLSVLAVVILALSCVSYGKFNTVSLYRTSFLFSLICILALPVLNENSAFASGVVFVSNAVFRSLVFICECQICARTGLSPVFVFGIIEALKRIPNLIILGLFGIVPVEVAASSPMGYLAFIQAAAVILVFVYILVFTERDVHLLTEFDRKLSVRDELEKRRMDIAEQYGLTERETEVFILLAEGRSSARIAEEIYLSKGTVNIHVQHIYKKLSIHSRQELLDIASPLDDR
ncbi:response regulator transcription factor [Adlercreutzia sp. ZJ138]|uniref:response regulator transcription factor n=1 Tax=Adlercreutzia sp. ZJ138 TaxID=2709405 RepID=UPI0013EC6E50|nr:helix-turn-helix transcriptional regulator [Adlercreutzia sp. ZJ138]